VKLRRSGGSYRGPCPLHGGKNPNFSVSPDKGFYHCFTCGESGDVFTFLQKVVGCDFVTAVRIVAERAGIEIKEEAGRGRATSATRASRSGRSTRPRPRTSPRRSGRAPTRPRRARTSSSARSAARSPTASGSGYAPRANAAKEHLLRVGYDEARLLEVGLLARRDESGETYAKFRDRLMIPIFDARGHTVGFGGRLLEDREGAAKYLNSPESPVFAKRRLLYNLHSARNAIRKDERAVLVEGYFDVIRLAAAGVESTGRRPRHRAERGARGGTREAHAHRLRAVRQRRRRPEGHLPRGTRAARAGDRVRVVSLPDGEDPTASSRSTARAASSRRSPRRPTCSSGSSRSSSGAGGSRSSRARARRWTSCSPRSARRATRSRATST
jgi:DNA primase